MVLWSHGTFSEEIKIRPISIFSSSAWSFWRTNTSIVKATRWTHWHTLLGWHSAIIPHNITIIFCYYSKPRQNMFMTLTGTWKVGSENTVCLSVGCRVFCAGVCYACACLFHRLTCWTRPKREQRKLQITSLIRPDPKFPFMNIHYGGRSAGQEMNLPSPQSGLWVRND